MFVPLILRSAPVLEMPLPSRASGSLPTLMPPWICKAAPEATLVPLVTEPSAVAFWMLSTPSLTVVVPV